MTVEERLAKMKETVDEARIDLAKAEERLSSAADREQEIRQKIASKGIEADSIVDEIEKRKALVEKDLGLLENAIEKIKQGVDSPELKQGEVESSETPPAAEGTAAETDVSTTGTAVEESKHVPGVREVDSIIGGL